MRKREEKTKKRETRMKRTSCLQKIRGKNNLYKHCDGKAQRKSKNRLEGRKKKGREGKMIQSSKTEEDQTRREAQKGRKKERSWGLGPEKGHGRGWKSDVAEGGG